MPPASGTYPRKSFKDPAGAVYRIGTHPLLLSDGLAVGTVTCPAASGHILYGARRSLLVFYTLSLAFAVIFRSFNGYFVQNTQFLP